MSVPTIAGLAPKWVLQSVVAQDNFVIATGLVFTVDKGAAEQRLGVQDGKEAVGDGDHANHLGLSLAGQRIRPKP